MRFALLLLLLLPLSRATAAPSALARAVRLFEAADFAGARDELAVLVDSPTLDAEGRARARAYLAASYFGLGDEASARAQLMQLARQSPDTRLDPGLFLPEVVALAERARAEVLRERRAAQPVPPPGVALAPSPALPPPAPPVGLAFVPFGVGQFANRQPVKGALFLGTEVLAFGTAAVSLGLLESMKRGPDDRFLQGGHFENVPLAQGLNTTSVASFWAGVGLATLGVVDALLSRPPPALAPEALGLQGPFGVSGRPVVGEVHP